uniref:Uncharacterized protein n=2 Tax=Anas TaxID=8835 RepID=A0A8B9VY99_9AVES
MSLIRRWKKAGLIGRDFLAAGLTLHYHFFLSHIAELCLPPTHPCKAKHSLLPPAPHTQAVTNLHACQLALLSRRHSLRTHPCPLSFSYILVGVASGCPATQAGLMQDLVTEGDLNCDKLQA